VIAALTLLAGKTCATQQFSYWRGLRVVASVNPTGETLLGQFLVLPALALASVYSWILGLSGAIGARTWARKRWFDFLKAYQKMATKVSVKG
jgi:hypothetical protein